MADEAQNLSTPEVAPEAIAPDSNASEPNPYTLGGELAVDINPLMGIHGDETPSSEEAPAAETPEEQPAGEAPEETPPAESPETPPETAKVEVLGREFEADTLKTIIENGEQYVERVAALEQAEQANKALIEHGTTYTDAMTILNQSPEGAREVIDLLIQSARERHGATFMAEGPAPKGAGDDGNIDFDDDILSEEGRALKRRSEEALKQRDVELAKLRTENQALMQKLDKVDQMLEKFEPVIETAKFADEADIHVTQIKKEFQVDVTPGALREMMRTTGLKDPIQAFKVANYDKVQKVAYDRGYQTGNREKPNMPKGEGRTFDATGMTADEIHEHLKKGKVPA